MKTITREITLYRFEELPEATGPDGRGVGECKLTGYCLDDTFLDGFRASFLAAELAGVVDLERHMDAGYEALFAEAVADYEYQCSDAALAERYADDWFTEDGEVDSCA